MIMFSYSSEFEGSRAMFSLFSLLIIMNQTSLACWLSLSGLILGMRGIRQSNVLTSSSTFEDTVRIFSWKTKGKNHKGLPGLL